MSTLASVAMSFMALISQRYPEEGDPVKTVGGNQLFDYYDFIIVGGGSAGSALANRLSEIPDWNVLLLEAGHQETIFTRTPAMWPALIQSQYDWSYATTEQKFSCQATGGVCRFPRGRMLGGSSGINAMIYVRGYQSDYDKWGTENCGWSFEDVEPYFLQSEGNTIPSATGHGKQGPLTVSWAPFTSPLADQFVRAGMAKGLRNTDCPAYEGGCVYHVVSTIRDGRRCSASTAYLEPISHKRSNLHIVTGAEVTRVLTENNRAIGVEFAYQGWLRTVLTSKEVILSAGSINSPKILMLSGIGPRQHLEDLGIQVLSDLPVGENLQDHAIVPMMFNFNNGTVNIDDLAKRANQEAYLNTQTGPFSYSGCSALAWVKIGDPTELSNKAPNVQISFYTESAQANVHQTIVAVSVVKPESRGKVRLNSTNPYGKPLIDVNYYADKRDWLTALGGLQYAFDLIQTWPLASFGATLDLTQQPFCQNTSSPTEFFNCLILFYTRTIYHPVGTVKMAPRTQHGVVNRDLQVHGIHNLRVIDASIPPSHISMNTNAMAIMIGEKGADIIKAAYGRPTHHRMRTCYDVPEIHSW